MFLFVPDFRAENEHEREHEPLFTFLGRSPQQVQVKPPCPPPTVAAKLRCLSYFRLAGRRSSVVVEIELGFAFRSTE
jgi:hypothetical protein